MALVDLPPNTEKAKAEREKRLKEREALTKRAISKEEKAKEKDKGMLDTFISKIIVNDIPDTKDFLVKEVIEPRIRAGILDVIIEGSRFLLGGDVRTGGTRVNTLRDGGTYINARRNDNTSTRLDSSNRDRNSRNSGGFDSRDYPLPSRGKAEEVIAILRQDIIDYDRATVAAFLKAVGVTPVWSDMDIGWYNLDEGTCYIRATIDGYLIVLPKPQSVKN